MSETIMFILQDSITVLNNEINKAEELGHHVFSVFWDGNNYVAMIRLKNSKYMDDEIREKFGQSRGQ